MGGLREKMNQQKDNYYQKKHLESRADEILYEHGLDKSGRPKGQVSYWQRRFEQRMLPGAYSCSGESRRRR